jgi:hypothetical protein
MKTTYCLTFVLLLSGLTMVEPASERSTNESLQHNMQAGKWEILFGGNSVDKWRSKSGNSFPTTGWKVEDGLLYLDGKGGDIITKEMYSDFELVFDFNLTKGANSGVKYFVDTLVSAKDGSIMVNGPEYQIIDDFNHSEVKEHGDKLISTASVYLLYAPKEERLKPAGQWNTGKIMAKGDHVEHWLNGVQVLSYSRGTKDFLERKSKTKFKDDEKYGELKSGHILLTDHHDKVYFRDIKIRKL